MRTLAARGAVGTGRGVSPEIPEVPEVTLDLSLIYIILKGAELDCNGFSVVNLCCDGHMITGQNGTSQNVGPHIGNCDWKYANHGYPVECGRIDEVVAGRCGSGQISRCPNDSSHGILCCELTVLE